MLPLPFPTESQVDHLAGPTVLAREDQQVQFISLTHFGGEVKAELLDEDVGSLGVFAFDGLARVTGFGDGLVVESQVGVLDIISSQPVVVLQEGDVDGPLETRGRTDDLAERQRSEGTASHLLTVLSCD